MNRWSVTWRLADHAVPAELDRLRGVFADDPDYLKDPDHYLDAIAREKWRTFERRPLADDKIRELIANSDITYIRLNRIEPWQHVMAWDASWDTPPHHMAKGRYSSAYHKRMRVTQSSIRRAHKAGDEAIARAAERDRLHQEADSYTTSGQTICRDPYHQMGEYLVQRNYLGRWHGYHKTLHQESFGTDEEAARDWLRSRPLPPLQTGGFHFPEPYFAHSPPATIDTRCHGGRTHRYKPYNSSCDLCQDCGNIWEKYDGIPLDPPPLDHEPQHSTDPMKFATDEQEHMPSSAPVTIDGLVPQTNGFTFRGYQREDIARAAMHDGAIIAWDPGLGKTMALFTFFMLKRARRVLIVAPAALHEQIIAEGLKFFGITVRPLPDQDTALAYMKEGVLPMPGRDESADPLPEVPDYFVTAYNWLGYNQADEWAAGEDETNDLIRRRRYVVAARLAGLSAPDLNALKKDSSPERILGVAKGAKPAAIMQAWTTAATLNDPALHPDDKEIAMRSARINDAFRKLTGTNGTEHDEAFSAQLQELRRSDRQRELVNRLRDIEKGIGLEMRPGKNSPEGIDKADTPIRCVFKPTLCSLVKDLFDGVVCDEAVRLKSGTAYQADGVLRMQARYRLALTGTPIKNKLPDLFFLASFVTGSKAKATARWPYGNRTQDRAQFAQDFGVWEENMTKQEKAREDGKTSIPRGKTDPTRICNIHRLWRVISTVLIRRRKDDVPGTDIVPKTVIPVRVMPGKEQQLTYEFQLHNRPPHKSDLAELGHQLQCLRQAALFPASRSLFRPGQPRAQSTERFTPKSAGIMQLAIDLMATGEQLVVFSPFQDFAADISDRLTRAGIPHLNLDGKTDPLKRGELVTRFKSGEFPILIAGIESMGEGHSLDTCSNLVLPSLAWAYDKNAQAVERVHRLTSKKPVNIYVMVTRNTIDERLVASFQEKTDSNDLALDGRLVETEKEEIDLGQLLRDAVKDFDSAAPTIDEREVEDQWALTLVPGLRDAYELFRELRPLPAAAPENPRKADQPRRKPAPVMILPDRTATVAAASSRQPQPPITQSPNPPIASPKPVRLFDLMQNLRRTTDPTPLSSVASAKEEPPAAATPAPEPAPAPPTPPVAKDPVIAIGKIIPFPGRLGKLIAGQPPKNPVALPACLS